MEVTWDKEKRVRERGHGGRQSKGKQETYDVYWPLSSIKEFSSNIDSSLVVVSKTESEF